MEISKNFNKLGMLLDQIELLQTMARQQEDNDFAIADYAFLLDPFLEELRSHVAYLKNATKHHER